MFPSIQQIEEVLESLEDIVYASVSAATPDLPGVRETFDRLWDDVSRFGPNLPDIHVRMPGLGDFHVPPPPPPPPPPKNLVNKLVDWCQENPWTVLSIGLSAGLLVGYGTHKYRVHRRQRVRHISTTSVPRERRQVVVVLGGDRPTGLHLILDLEKKGYIVITSVESPTVVESIESKTHGYVRALILESGNPDSVPVFLRSLASSLTRKFPINSAGDPHVSPSTQPYILSVISLLTLTPSSTPALMPLEYLPLEPIYLPYLTSTHVVPLQVIQALLPLLRSSPSRARDALSNGTGRQSIIVCLPVTDTRVGLPFAGAQAMSASATLQGLQVLRREIKIASLSMVNPEVMKNIRVVTVEVGAIDIDGYDRHHHKGASDVQTFMDDWSGSEKSVYGQSLLTVNGGNVQVGKSRKPTPVSHFVRTIVNIVNGHWYGSGLNAPFVVTAFYKLRSWLRGDKFSVGAGAGTYVLASNLPSSILDVLINLPHFLISIRNGLLPTTKTRMIPTDQLPPPAIQQQIASTKTDERQVVEPPTVTATEAQDEESSSGDEKHSNPSSNDDADVESNAGDASVVESSWVNLNENHE